MRATLCREYFDKQTQGTLTVYDGDEEVFQCKTLELPDLNNQRGISCIPEGVYDTIPRTSQKYSDHLHITNVPDRSFILIHWGNYAGSKNPRTGQPDIRGCVLVGKDLVDIDGDGIKDITSSKATFKELMKVAPEGFELTVTQ